MMLATTTTVDWGQVIAALVVIIGAVGAAWGHLHGTQKVTQAKIDAVASDVSKVATGVAQVAQGVAVTNAVQAATPATPAPAPPPGP